jgi:hypothetical protein
MISKTVRPEPVEEHDAPFENLRVTGIELPPATNWWIFY